MPIPVGRLYQKKELGSGTVATIENNVVNTVTSSGDINFGVAIDIQNGKAVTATKAPIFGIAIKRTYIEGDDYTALEDDHWYENEVIPVMRKGGISVPISDDVDRYDQATVNADGSFKTAGAGEPVVGRFLTSGDKDKTAILQIELTDMGTTGVGQPTNTPNQQTTPSTSANTQTDNSANATKKGDK